MLLEYLVFLLAYVFWIISLLGFGNIFLTLCKLARVDIFPSNGGHLAILIMGLMGMIIVTTLSTLINFFLPVNLAVSIIIMTIGLAMFAINWKKILGYVDKSELILLTILALLVFIIIPFTWVCWYDTGLYHLPTIKWIVESQIPLGLANLQGRFGFNCSWLMLSACIDQWVIYLDKPYFILNGIMTLLYASAILLVIKRKFFAGKYRIIDLRPAVDDSGDKKGLINLSDLFMVFSSITLVYPGLMLLTSPSPDLPIMIITLLVTYLVMYDLEHFYKNNFYSILVVIITVYALTVKLSAIPLLLTLFLFLLRPVIEEYARKHEHKSSNAHGKVFVSYIYLATVFALIIMPWLVRGVLLSGYLFFPLPFGHFENLPWTVPAPLAESETKWTTAWARAPGPYSLSSLSGWDWIKPWFERYFNAFGWTHIPLSRHITAQEINGLWGWLSDNLIISFLAPINAKLFTPTIILTSGIILLAYFTFIKKVHVKEILGDSLVWAVPMLISIVGIIFWFYSAPDLRFGFGFINSLILIIFSMPLFLYIAGRPKSSSSVSVSISKRLKKIATMLLLVVVVYSGCIIFYYSTNTELWGSNGFDFPSINLKESITLQGNVIYTTSAGEQQVWNGPLPNTPYFNETIKIEYLNGSPLPYMFWYQDKNSLPIPL